ncbi:ribonuclease P [Thermococci archaeon]|nr:MAG: ribonuclease P [Thermococci archaeon]
MFRRPDRDRVTPKNIVWHELIGLKAKIIKSPHQGFMHIEGVVIDETKNTLKILGDKLYTVPKDQVEIAFEVGDKEIMVDGKELIGRPEMRLKKRWRK